MAKSASSSYLEVNEKGVKCDLATIGYYDEGTRYWFAFRWKYGMRKTSRLKVLRRKIKAAKERYGAEEKEKEKGEEGGGGEGEVMEKRDALVFDRPFDYYIFDRKTELMYLGGSIVQ